MQIICFLREFPVGDITCITNGHFLLRGTPIDPAE